MTAKSLTLALVVACIGAGVSLGAFAGDTSCIVLHQADTSRRVELPPHTSFEIRLEANPSTGYGWEVVSAQNVTVKLPITVEKNPEVTRPMVGAPGTAVIRATSGRPGRASITVVYRRPWEATVGKTLYYRFAVKSPSR